MKLMLMMVVAGLIAPVMSAQIVIEGDGTGAEACLKIVDKNKDGWITYAETRDARKELFKELKKNASIEDKDKRDQTNTETEMKYSSAFDVMTPYLFAIIDANHDSNLSKKELEAVDDGDYKDIKDGRVMKWVLEQEFAIASDVYGDGKGKQLDHDALEKMAGADAETVMMVDEFCRWLAAGLDAKLEPFRQQAERERAEKAGKKSDIKKQDLSKQKVKQRDFVKTTLKLWQKNKMAAWGPAKDKKEGGDDLKDAHIVIGGDGANADDKNKKKDEKPAGNDK